MNATIPTNKGAESGSGRNESWALANLLSGRYGPLALTRAAGEAAAAERKGDEEQKALWHDVITDLRLAAAAEAEKR